MRVRGLTIGTSSLFNAWWWIGQKFGFIAAELTLAKVPMRNVDDVKQYAAIGGHVKAHFMRDLCMHWSVELAWVLLASPMSEFLPKQWSALCVISRLPLSLWRIVKFSITDMGCACIELHIGHLRYSKTLPRNIASLLCVLQHVTRRLFATIVCAGMRGNHCARNA